MGRSASKTTVARELASLLADGRISDPERIGGTSELVGCWAFEEAANSSISLAEMWNVPGGRLLLRSATRY